MSSFDGVGREVGGEEELATITDCVFFIGEDFAGKMTGASAFEATAAIAASMLAEFGGDFISADGLEGKPGVKQIKLCENYLQNK